jgi:eukaryotic-like serine/threonine-protein kinase
MQSSAEDDDVVMKLAEEAMLLSHADRQRFLSLKCKDHGDLYSQVAEVVEWEERMGDFLRQPLIELVDLDEAEAVKKPFYPPQEISERFFVVREIGEGGMAVVYEAMDRKRGKRIAIKCAKPGFGSLLSPELEAALKVRHPNICLVNDTPTVKTASGEVEFLTMEFIEGETLSARLARERMLHGEEALSIARQLCAGLAAAHEAGILHRDLKTSNVILSRKDDGAVRAVITDFGLASEARLENGLEGGTPRYMAPELWHDQKPSKASDVYALGVILYEIVTGSPPFNTRDAWDLKPPKPPQAPSLFNKDLDGRWDRVILGCLDPEPGMRPQAADVLKSFEKRPVWKSPTLVIALLSLVGLIAGFQGPLMRLLKPAEIRLAILPVQADAETAARGQDALRQVAESIQHSNSSANLFVTSAADSLRQGIDRPEQAYAELNATHAMELVLRHDGEAIVSKLTIFDLTHGALVADFESRYSPVNVPDMAGAFAGAATAALHLHPAKSDLVSPAANEWYSRGLRLLDMDDPDYGNAIPLFEEAAQRDQHSVLPLAALAEAQFDAYDATQEEFWLTRSRQTLQAAEALNPDSIAVHRVEGLLERAEGNHAKALEEHRRVLEIDPKNIDAMVNIASLYNALHQPEKAIEVYRQAEAVDPGNYKPYEWFGSFYFRLGLQAEAEQQFRLEVAHSPERLTAYSNLAGILSNEGKNEEALKILEDSLKIKVTPAALNNAGAALAYLGRDREAADYYRRAVQLFSNYRYWLNLADSERRLHHPAAARSAYQNGEQLAIRELQTQPQVAETRSYVAHFEARLGEKRRAHEEVAQALHAAPADSQVIRNAVLTYNALGERDRALRALEQATLPVLLDVERHPDLADFCQDSRFKEVKARKQEGG